MTTSVQILTSINVIFVLVGFCIFGLGLDGLTKGNSLPHDGEEILDDSTFLCAFCPA